MKSFTSLLSRSALPLAAMLLLPTLAHAHVGVGETSGFGHGFGHPLGGLDHLAAMVAVGLWAAQMGGRALWAVPLTFVGVMALGGMLGVMGIAVPMVEPGIIASVLVLGLLIATAARLPLALSMGLVGLFAVCHGYAHGAEMPETATGLLYGVGFILATAMLHTVGILLGIGIERLSAPRLVRFAGVAIMLCGVALWVV